MLTVMTDTERYVWAVEFAAQWLRARMADVGPQ